MESVIQFDRQSLLGNGSTNTPESMKPQEIINALSLFAPAIEVLKARGTLPMSRAVKLFKRDEAQRLVGAVVYEPDKVDADGDWASAEDIEKAAHRFMENYQAIGLMHRQSLRDVRLVESYILPCELSVEGEMVKKGSWIVVMKVYNDRVWSMIQDGTLTGVSMGGYSYARE